METALLTIWPFLNLLVWVGSIGLFMRFISRFSQNFGCGSAALVFLVGVSMCKSPDDTKSAVRGNKDTYLLQEPQPKPPVLTITTRKVTLIKSPSFDVIGDIIVVPTTLRDSCQTGSAELNAISINMVSWGSGFTAGLQWQPIASSVSLSANRQIRYSTSGQLIWRVLSVPVYRQYKLFEGEVAI
ncbi:hypothetical protein [Fibrella aquatica]|uniref:hypothetical protein n=1 Tax=Fibrella aquatica TaxID=3242487 RepID=UPI0035220EEA